MKFARKRGKESPAVSTASLPDIIFMLLFFFMVVTVLRSSDLLVNVVVPSATELTKLEKKSLVNNINIGKPKEQYRQLYGTAPAIQLNDKISTVQDIPVFLEQHRVKIREKERPRITTSLKIDGEVTMGIVQDVKTQLRKSGQLRLNYSARPQN